MPKSQITLPLTDEHYVAIGRVTARAATLDAVIDFAIWTLTGMPEPVGRIMTTRLESMDRLRRLESLCTMKVTEHDEIRLPRVFKSTRRALEDRNRIVHALWSAGEIDGVPVSHRYSVGKKLKHSKDEWPPEKIARVAVGLENAAGELFDFLRLLEPSEPVTLQT